MDKIITEVQGQFDSPEWFPESTGNGFHGSAGKLEDLMEEGKERCIPFTDREI